VWIMANLTKTITTYSDGSLKIVEENKPIGTFGYLLHDFETTYWYEIKEGVIPGVSRGYPRMAVGQPETVNTYEKDNKQHLSVEWQEFYKKMWCLAAFGVADLNKFGQIENQFNSAMASNRVITNFSDWINGYMTLGMGGNIVRVLGEGRPPGFGMSYTVETLNSSEPPPDVVDVFYNKPWLWSKATVSRYAKPEEGKTIDPWHSVDPFPQLANWNAHTPLMLISSTGKANMLQCRVQIMENYNVPNPYNPEQIKSYPQ